MPIRKTCSPPCASGWFVRHAVVAGRGVRHHAASRCDGRRFLWTAATGVTTSEALFGVVETDECRRSPFAIVCDPRKPVRYRFATDGCPDIPVLRELEADGATDYPAFPLRFSDGTTH